MPLPKVEDNEDDDVKDGKVQEKDDTKDREAPDHADGKDSKDDEAPYQADGKASGKAAAKEKTQFHSTQSQVRGSFTRSRLTSRKKILLQKCREIIPSIIENTDDGIFTWF